LEKVRKWWYTTRYHPIPPYHHTTIPPPDSYSLYGFLNSTFKIRSRVPTNPIPP
jgi:hypothetical protein